MGIHADGLHVRSLSDVRSRVKGNKMSLTFEERRKLRGLIAKRRNELEKEVIEFIKVNGYAQEDKCRELKELVDMYNKVNPDPPISRIAPKTTLDLKAN